MTSVSRDDSERFGFSVGRGIFLALASGLSALWFSRSYYFNSDRVGWGDVSADRNQTLFWWGTAISVAVSLLLVIVTTIRSERFRLALGGAGTLTGIVMLLTQRPELRYAAVMLIPGIFAFMMAFGVHAGPDKWVRFLWMFGVNTVFYTSIIGGVLALLNRGKRLHGKAKS
jgi:hypothetical protein